ncbi:MAG: PIN domain-containing protein [Deltaproteobacteria bacterium]|nr:PIN domain-containing protein [Deltaproteobacteria bacterium]
MIAFFDTNIYVDLLKGNIEFSDLSSYQGYLIRLSPIVKSELLRGCKTERAKKITLSLVEQLTELPAPTNKMWERAASILAKLPILGQTRLGELQNDVLLALTTRQVGAIFITQDKDFEEIQKHLTFNWILHT